MKTNSPLNKNNRLGRGLEALLGPAQESDQVLLLDIEKVQPDRKQPRSAFDKESLEKLASSIKTHGVLQPILVQQKGESYQIIAGERRWRAAGQAGLRQIPAILKSPDPAQHKLWALIENIQREDLSSIEEARAFEQILKENNISQEALAKSMGRSRSSVANTLRLLQLDKEVQKLIEEKQISFAQARELLRFKSPLKQRQMAQRCLKGLTVKDINSKVETKSKPPYWVEKSLSHLEKLFSQRLKLDYRKGRGRLIFSFKNEEELKAILNKLWNK